MSLKDLSKEQKQYVALGLLSSSILIILMVLGIRFSMTTISAAKEELDGLTAKINRANKALSRSRQTSEDYVETIAVLKKYLTNAPPERNYYSWATEVIYSMARFAGLEIDSIDEISMSQQRRSVTDADAAAISFESYSLRITGHGGYENTKYFMNLLKKNYPLVRFSGVEISSGQNPESHDVQLFMQWPFNFGEITRNWDAIASTQMKIAESKEGDELATPKKPVSDPAAPVKPISKKGSAREPHPPTTRPEFEANQIVKQAAPKTQPVMSDGSQIASRPAVAGIKPATHAEIQTSLSGTTSRDAELVNAESRLTSMSDTPCDSVATGNNEKMFKVTTR